MKKIEKTSSKTAAKTEEGLNLQQELFCQLYVNADREVFGNGAQCYLAIYGPDHLLKYNKPMKFMVAAALASRLLTKVKVIERINSLLQEGGFNNENVDKQHLFLINQHSDLKTKMAAIREYNELKDRIKKKLEITGANGEPLFNDEHRDKAKQAINEIVAGNTR